MGNSVCLHCDNKIYSSKKCVTCKKHFHKNCLYLIHKISLDTTQKIDGFLNKSVYEIISKTSFNSNLSAIKHDKKRDRVNYAYQCSNCYKTTNNDLYTEWILKYNQYQAKQRLKHSMSKKALSDPKKLNRKSRQSPSQSPLKSHSASDLLDQKSSPVEQMSQAIG